MPSQKATDYEDFSGYSLIPSIDQMLAFFGFVPDTSMYDQLSHDEQRLFDQLFPELVHRERSYRHLASLGTLLVAVGTTLFGVRAAIYAAGFAPLAIVDALISLTAFVVGLCAITFSRIRLQQKVYAEREATLKNPGTVPALQAYKGLDSHRREICQTLNNLMQQFKIAESQFEDDDLQISDAQRKSVHSVLNQCVHWIKDSQDLMSDDAINIVKDVLLNQRGNYDLPIDKHETLSEAATDLYQNMTASSKPPHIKDSKDSLYHIKGFSEGWQKLTKLPEDKQLVEAIDYDYLVADYTMNKDRISHDIKVFTAIVHGFLSDDPTIRKHVLDKVDALAISLKNENKKYLVGQKKILSEPSALNSQDVLRGVISIQRNTKTPQLIENTLALYQKTQDQQRVIQNQKGLSEQAALQKHQKLVSNLNKKFFSGAEHPDSDEPHIH